MTGHTVSNTRWPVIKLWPWSWPVKFRQQIPKVLVSIEPKTTVYGVKKSRFFKEKYVGALEGSNLWCFSHCPRALGQKCHALGPMPAWSLPWASGLRSSGGSRQAGPLRCGIFSRIPWAEVAFCLKITGHRNMTGQRNLASPGLNHYP